MPMKKLLESEYLIIFIKVVYYYFYINCISVKLLESKHCIFSKFHNDFVIK